ncbi:MAG: class I SAM-dependent methyltransferase [Pseudomonadota bacterium]
MSNDRLQKDDFIQDEGDAWFRRNRAQLGAPSEMRAAFAARVAANLGGVRSSVLEIGAAEGANLALLQSLADIEAHGIEPSAHAVEAGSLLHPSIHLRTGTADELPYERASFDVVWFGFCLYLVDRDLLFRAVAEADRVLRSGGLLVIVDFDPDGPSRRHYHHRPGIWSYKMDHSRLFLANPAYRLVDKLSASHQGVGWVEDPQERLALWLCRKDTANAYAVYLGDLGG